MKHSKEEIEIIAKSMYKAVKKTLSKNLKGKVPSDSYLDALDQPSPKYSSKTDLKHKPNINPKDFDKKPKKKIKKALGTGISHNARDGARAKTGKEVVADVLDPNFVAEAKDKVPPSKVSTMNKSTRSGREHDKKVAAGKKSKWEAKYKTPRSKEKGVHHQDMDFPNKKGQSVAGSYTKGNKRRATSDWGVVSNKENKEDVKHMHNKVISEQNQMKKPNLPKSEQDTVKSEKGINKLKNFIKKKCKQQSLIH